MDPGQLATTIPSFWVYSRGRQRIHPASLSAAPAWMVGGDPVLVPQPSSKPAGAPL